MTYEELLRNINKGIIERSYIFEGKEEALKNDAILRIRDKTAAKLVFDEKENEKGDIFGEKKIIVLKGLSKIALIKEDILSIITIVCVEEIKNFKPQAQIVNFPRLYGERLKLWIKERFKEKGRIIEDPAVEFIIEATGGDVSFIIPEIEKITIFCDKRALNKDSIAPILCKTLNKNIFRLLDKIGLRRMEALSICSSLILQGASHTYILSMIEKRFEEIFLLKDKEISPWQLRKISTYKGLFSKDEIYSIFQHLLDCDIKLKSYSQTSRTLLLLSLIYHIISRAKDD